MSTYYLRMVLDHPGTIFKEELEKKLLWTEEIIDIAQWLASGSPVNQVSLEKALVACVNTEALWIALTSDKELIYQSDLEAALMRTNLSCFYCVKAIKASSDKMKNDYEQLLIDYHNKNTADVTYLYRLLKRDDTVNSGLLEAVLISSEDFFLLALHYVVKPTAIDRDRIEKKLTEMINDISSLLPNAYKEKEGMENKLKYEGLDESAIPHEIEKMECGILIRKAEKYREVLMDSVFLFNGASPGNGSGNQPPMWISGYKIKNIALEQALLNLIKNCEFHWQQEKNLLSLLLYRSLIDRKPFLKMILELKKQYPSTKLGENSRDLTEELNTVFGERL